MSAWTVHVYSGGDSGATNESPVAVAARFEGGSESPAALSPSPLAPSSPVASDIELERERLRRRRTSFSNSEAVRMRSPNGGWWKGSSGRSRSGSSGGSSSPFAATRRRQLGAGSRATRRDTTHLLVAQSSERLERSRDVRHEAWELDAREGLSW